MNIDPTKRNISRFWLGAVLFLPCLITTYVVLGLQDSSRNYQFIQEELESPLYSGSVTSVSFPGAEKPLHIPSWRMFDPGTTWSLVSQSETLDSSFVPENLTELTIPHGDSSLPMQVQIEVNKALTPLVSDARTDGHDMMISSAYRSIAEQQRLYESFVKIQGITAAEQYVADPGASEHHTGLAVDFSNSSDSCALNSDHCSLSMETANWLAENAYRYGFILRYPLGKQPITGIAHEPWHYRYVGIPLAKMVHQSGLTLDEALTQMRPIYAIR